MHRHLWNTLPLLAVLSMIAAYVVLMPRTALACSCAGGNAHVYTADGNVPVDFQGIPVTTTLYPKEPQATFTLEKWVDDAWAPQTFTTTNRRQFGETEYYAGIIMLQPDSFEVGDRFRVHAENDFIPHNSYEIEVSNPLPKIQGSVTIHIGDTVEENVSVPAGGPCQEQVWAATRTVTIELPEEFEPYRDLFLYQTSLNDSVWLPRHGSCSSTVVGRTWQRNAGTDMIAATCEAQYSDSSTYLPDPSSVTIKVNVFLPNSGVPIWTSDVIETDLNCSDTCVVFDDEQQSFVPCKNDDNTNTDEDHDSGCAASNQTNAALLTLFLCALLLVRRRLA